MAMETKKKAAFYCRMNHRDKDYRRFLPEVERKLDEKYGAGKWMSRTFFEIASGADKNRKEFNRLLEAVREGKVDAVVSKNAAMLSRDWRQFLTFLSACEKSGVEVLSLEEEQDAWRAYVAIRNYFEKFFEGAALDEVTGFKDN